jgi:hypothetical protein
MPAPTFDTVKAGGHKEMSSFLADQLRPRIFEPKCAGEGGVAGFAGSQPMSTAVNMQPKETSEI